jgi:6-phosphogluconolactonase
MKQSQPIDLSVYESRQALVDEFVRQWLEAMENCPAARLVALSGGRLAEPLFSTLAHCIQSGSALCEKVHFFWADERCVPPDHADSNYALARRFLFVPRAIGADQIHRIQGDRDSVQAAHEAERELVQVAQRMGRTTAAVDFVWLGLGEDGHVASLFPCNLSQDLANPRLYHAVVGPKPPPVRVTLSYSALATAREVWVTAVGPEKKEALRQSLLPDGNTPLSEVLRQRSRTRIFATADSI